MITHEAVRKKASNRATAFFMRIPDVMLGCLLN
jgi:hypothetical protein